MLQAPSRASTASSSSFQPLTRQNTMSSYDGSRSARQSKRYSMSALYMSMSANESDLVIEDDLAKGWHPIFKLRKRDGIECTNRLRSAKGSSRAQSQDFLPVQEELRLGERCALPGFAHRPADPESHGPGGGECFRPTGLQTSRTNITIYSKTKLRAISKKPLKCKRAFFPTTTRRRSTGICSSCSSLNPGTLHISVDSSQWPKSTRCCKLSCSPFMVTSTKAVRSTCS